MSTASLQKTPVEAKWSTAQIQEAAAKAMSGACMAATGALEKIGPQAVEAYQDATTAKRAEFIKALGVKTPLELVKAMAEFETNVFGSKINISGDEKSASLEYEYCGCFNAIQKQGLTPEQMESMPKRFQAGTEKLAKQFGFKGEVKMDGQKAVLTFTK